MSTAGYSGTPLPDKLGIRPSTRLLLVNAPPDYFDWVGQHIKKQVVKNTEVADLVHLFATDFRAFETGMKSLASLIRRNRSIVIWISWYKKAAKIETDLTEDRIRNYALAHDLVDVKVCAVSDTWSGLKLVVPVAKR